MEEPVIVQQESYARTVLGFWVYLISDCILFGTLFATYAVLRNSTFGGPSAQELFHLPYALLETFILLLSSFTSGIALWGAYKKNKQMALSFFFFTFCLGFLFLLLELQEFHNLIRDGNSWSRSAFLSSYFALVSTHGAHIFFGLFWMLVMMIQIIFQRFSLILLRKLTCLTLFWHFLDIIWIFIFTFVYLAGKIR